MKITETDLEVFREIKKVGVCSLASLTDRRGKLSRVERLISLGMVERLPDPNEHCFQHTGVTYACVKCGCVGTPDEKTFIQANDACGGKLHSCPKCLHDTFYVL